MKIGIKQVGINFHNQLTSQMAVQGEQDARGLKFYLYDESGQVIDDPDIQVTWNMTIQGKSLDKPVTAKKEGVYYTILYPKLATQVNGEGKGQITVTKGEQVLRSTPYTLRIYEDVAYGGANIAELNTDFGKLQKEMNELREDMENIIADTSKEVIAKEVEKQLADLDDKFVFDGQSSPFTLVDSGFKTTYSGQGIIAESTSTQYGWDLKNTVKHKNNTVGMSLGLYGSAEGYNYGYLGTNRQNSALRFMFKPDNSEIASIDAKVPFTIDGKKPLTASNINNVPITENTYITVSGENLYRNSDWRDGSETLFNDRSGSFVELKGGKRAVKLQPATAGNGVYSMKRDDFFDKGEYVVGITQNTNEQLRPYIFFMSPNGNTSARPSRAEYPVKDLGDGWYRAFYKFTLDTTMENYSLMVGFSNLDEEVIYHSVMVERADTPSNWGLGTRDVNNRITDLQDRFHLEEISIPEDHSLSTPFDVNNLLGNYILHVGGEPGIANGPPFINPYRLLTVISIKSSRNYQIAFGPVGQIAFRQRPLNLNNPWDDWVRVITSNDIDLTRSGDNLKIKALEDYIKKLEERIDKLEGK